MKRSDGNVDCNACNTTIAEHVAFWQDGGYRVCAWCIAQLTKRLSNFLMLGGQ